MARGLLIVAAALAALMTVALASACGGDSSIATNTAIVPERLTPETVNPTPTAETATHPSPATEPQTGFANRPSSAEGVPAGERETPAPSPSEGQVNTPANMQPATVEAESLMEDVATISKMVEGYWGALNDYDVDLALTMLEDSYRAQEEDLIRTDIGRMKLFRVKLGVSVEKPLSLNEAGDYEIYLNLKTPVDTRRVKMVFRKIEGQWRIVFSDEVE